MLKFCIKFGDCNVNLVLMSKLKKKQKPKLPLKRKRRQQVTENTQTIGPFSKLLVFMQIQDMWKHIN